MARMVVIYKTPKDPKAFDEHYYGVHIPLAKQLPGLRRYTVSKGAVTTMASAKDTYLVGTLEFESMAAIKEAFMSDLGRACAEDRRILAADEDVEMYLFDSEDV